MSLHPLVRRYFGHRRKVWLFAVGVPREGWRAVGSASLAVQRKLDRRGHRKAAEPVIERSNLYCFTDGQRFADFAGAELLPEPEGQP